MAHIQSMAYKQRVNKYFDKQVQSREFQASGCISRRVDGLRKEAN